jgi:hypothetical protein
MGCKQRTRRISVSFVFSLSRHREHGEKIFAK